MPNIGPADAELAGLAATTLNSDVLKFHLIATVIQ